MPQNVPVLYRLLLGPLFNHAFFSSTLSFSLLPWYFLVFLHSLLPLVLCALLFPSSVVTSVSPFGLCPPTIKTHNTEKAEKAPRWLPRSQGRNIYLPAGPAQSMQLKSLCCLMSHWAIRERTHFIPLASFGCLFSPPPVPTVSSLMPFRGSSSKVLCHSSRWCMLWTD